MNTNKTNVLENFDVNIKIKLAFLWTATTFCYLYGDYFELYVPEKVDSLITGETGLDSPTVLLIASLLLAIPSIMIVISIFIRPKINRILNIIFGTFFTLITIFTAITSLTAWYSFYVFLGILESLITILIAWNAWKWPKQTD